MLPHDENLSATSQQWRQRVPGIAGLRVLSFGTAIAGNVTSMMLAELGADVVKIESPVRPDPLRIQVYADQPRYVEPSGAETNIMFAGFTRSLRSIALDMKDPADQETFARLLGVSDVLIDNFAADVMERWGFGHGRIREVNPSLVHLSVSGYGRTGPRSRYMAYGTNVNAFVGLSRAWVPHGTQLDYGAVAHALPAILAALGHRDATDEGVFIDLAQTESGASLAAPLYLAYLNGAPDSIPPPNESPGSLLAEVFPAKGLDRWLAVELEDVEDWNAACTFLGTDGLVLPTGAIPDSAAIEAMRTAVAAWSIEHTPHQGMLLMQRAGLAVGAVHDGEDLYRDVQHRSRGFFVKIDHPDLGSIEYSSPWHRLSRTPVAVRGPSPRLGQHTDEVLAEWIGGSGS